MIVAQKFILIVYDISNDKRRTKLHDVLLNFGAPVQYSVFECLLSIDEEEKMRKAVYRVIRPRVDAVRFYYLCLECLKKTRVTSGPEVLAPQTGAIVVG